MIVSKVRRGRLAKWGLGKHKPPEDLPKNVELIWNQDSLRWELYLLTHRGAISCDDELTWQMSTPFKRVVTTSEVKNFIQKHDTSEGGAVSLEERQRRWVQMFKDSNDREERRDQKILDDAYYEVGHMSKFLGRLEEGLRQVVVPITVGVTKEGKAIRAYPKVKKEIICPQQ